MKNIFYSLLLSLLIMTPAVADTIVRIAPLTNKIVTTTTSATGTETALPATALKGRENITIQNTSASTETVWIGPTGVSSSTGFPLNSSTPSISLDLNDKVILYVISDGTSVDVRCIESK